LERLLRRQLGAWRANGETDDKIFGLVRFLAQSYWNKWMSDHGKMITDTGVGGKTKCVSSGGTADTKNDIMLYSFVEAESHEAAAKSFENHPHLQIPQSSIEVMEIRPMTGM
jgi:hypothetical protein